jgi:hypothetical protein
MEIIRNQQADLRSATAACAGRLDGGIFEASHSLRDSRMPWSHELHNSQNLSRKTI